MIYTHCGRMSKTEVQFSKRYSSVKKSYKLSSKFVSEYKTKTPPFGFNGLGEFVYKRTYSRLKEDGQSEDW